MFLIVFFVKIVLVLVLGGLRSIIRITEVQAAKRAYGSAMGSANSSTGTKCHRGDFVKLFQDLRAPKGEHRRRIELTCNSWQVETHRIIGVRRKRGEGNSITKDRGSIRGGEGSERSR